jgi:hypothetical protein
MLYSDKVPESKTIDLTDFSKGVYNVPAETVPQGGFYALENCEYDPNDNSLVSCAGLTKKFKTTQGDSVDSFFYSDVFGTFFFSAGSKLYSTDLTEQTLLGTLTGANPARFHHFDNYLTIASGGILQYYNGSTLKTVLLPTPVSLTTITNSSYSATATTGTTYHNLTAGMSITITGASPEAYNGTFLITAVTDYTFTFTLASVPASSASPVGVYSVVDNRPNLDSVIDKEGRLVGTKSGDDYQYYSGIGVFKDVAGWTTNINDSSTAQKTRIGYDDSASTVVSAMLSTDAIVFKSPKRAYRIYGVPGDSGYATYELSRDIDVANRNCVANVKNNLFIFGEDGFDAIQTVQSYGSMQVIEPSIAGTWAPFFRQNKDDSCRIWVVASRAQIWIRYNNGGRIAIYHFNANAFTFRSFEHPVVDVTEKGTDVYVVTENTIYVLDEQSSSTETTEILAQMELGNLSGVTDYIISFYRFALSLKTNVGEAQCIIPNNANGNDFVISLSGSVSSPIAYLDTQNAFQNTDPLVYGDQYATAKSFCNYRATGFQPKVKVLSGRFALREMKFKVRNG